MKRSILLFFFFLGIININQAQVFSVKYLIEYNESNSLYDCKMVIIEGAATTYPQRVQFNAQYTIVVPTGSTLNIQQLYNPIENNQNYTGTIPCIWESGGVEIAPPTQPENDFHGIFPNLSPVSAYNNLIAGDTVTLFAISVDVDPCENAVRPFMNGVDPSSTEMPSGGDFSNGMTIGGAQQLYDGNLSSTYTGGIWTVSLPDYEVCEGECVELIPDMGCAPEDLIYLWTTGENTPTITVCPDQITDYAVEINGPNSAFNSASNTVSVIEAPIGTFSGPSTICVGETTFVTPTSGGTWTTDNSAIATVTNAGVVTGVSAGTTTLYFTDTFTGCISEGIVLTVNPKPDAEITGSDSICVMGTTTLIPNTGGTWNSSNNIVGSVDNSGNVTGHSVGTVTFTFTDLATGCASDASETVWVVADPEVEITGDDRICIGETTTVSSNQTGTWVSNNTSVATVDPNSGLVTGVGQGAVTITFTDNITGCSATTTGIIVDPNPSVSTNTDTICITTTANLNPSSGGVWTALNPSIASLVGTTVTGVASGDAGFIFTSDATGCISDTLYINVDSGPTTTLTGPNLICIGGTTTIEPSVGGTWSSADNTIATIDNFGNITGVGAGVTVFTFTSASTLCASDPSEPITVLPLPIVNAPSTSLCIGETMHLSPAGGGSWVTSDPSVATVNAFTGEVTTISAGTVTCSYTDAMTGCAATTNIITVHEKPMVEFTGPDVICAGFTTAVSPSTGGTWIASEHNIATVDNLGNVTGISPGMTDLVFTNTTTGCSSDPLKVTVLAAPEVSNPGDNYLCIGETTQLLPSSGGTWTSADPTIVTITAGGLAMGVSAGATGCTFTSSTTGCSAELAEFITVNGSETVVLEDNLLCIGESTVALSTAIGTWVTSDPSVATIDANTGVITAIAEGSVTVTQTNSTTGCVSQPSETLIVEQCDLFATSCDEIDPDNIICDYDLLDNFEGSLYTDNSFGDQPSGELCDSGEEAGNIQWLGFVAGEGDYEIAINYTNCISSIAGITGIKVGLYSDCDFDESNLVFCEVNLQNESVIKISSDLLVAEKVYYLYIDGMGNAPCEYAIEINGVYDDSFCNELSKVTGTAFIDINENGLFDSGETPLRNVLISLFPGNFSVLTNDEGKYIIDAPKGGATLTAKVNEGDWEEDFLTIEDVSIFKECVEDIDFGFIPSSNSAVSATLSVSNSIVRCDWETRFYITVENTGTQPFDGLLEFTFDDKATFFSSPIPNLNVNGNMVSSEIGELLPFTPQEYQVTLKMPSGTANLPILEFKAELKQANEAPVTEYSYGEQLRCSYDPNDKREFPDRPGEENLTLMDEDIEYTIRFQNNGNDTAFTVKIVDELDPSIDPRSIRVVNSSHDVETCIEGNQLIFMFENINLVDSMTNYEGSLGFVTFRSSTKAGVAESTPVYNSADIIFDTNQPIITNSTINTLVSKLCSDVETEIDMEICIGDMYNGYEESGVYTDTYTTEFGCDSVVVLNLEVYDVTYTSQDIQVCEGDSIEVNGTIYSFDESQVVMDTVLNHIGCVSNVTTYDFKVIPTLFFEIDTTICEGMDYNGLEESGVYTLESFDPITGCDIFTTVDLEILPLSDPTCTVGIDEEMENEVRIYPNPAYDMVNIESLSEIESVAIYTIDYSKVSEELFVNRSTKVQLSVEELNHGLYFLAIKSGGRFLYKKLIIK